MFELWIKMYDAMNKMVTEALTDSFESANSLMQRAAKQGFDLAGPGGGTVGGIWGWTYGSVLGSYQGAGKLGGIALTLAAPTAGPRSTRQSSKSSTPRPPRVKAVKK